MATESKFAHEWTKYSKIIPLYEHQFLSWVHPFKSADFEGKRVLDAGCGTGRNTYWPLKYGAAEGVAFDMDQRITDVAKRNLSEFDNAKVVTSSIYDISFQDEFDITFSIGVIHHLDKPREAIAKLVQAAKPGGTILIWVYGKEGYRRLKKAINTIRKVTSKIPLKVLHFLTYPFSLLFFAFIKFLPHRHPYLTLLKPASFWHIHSILYDQLLPDISNYWSREETIALFDNLPVKDVRATFCNEGSWTVTAVKQKA